MKLEGIILEKVEVWFTPNGQMLGKGNLEVQDREGSVKLVVWDKMAKDVSEAILKGDKVEVTGYFKTRWWTEPKGEKRSSEEFTVNRVRLLERPEPVKYCCLSCCHFNADCMTGCYNALGSKEDRETCKVEEGECREIGTAGKEGVPMMQKCWESK